MHMVDKWRKKKLGDIKIICFMEPKKVWKNKKDRNTKDFYMNESKKLVQGIIH